MNLPTKTLIVAAFVTVAAGAATAATSTHYTSSRALHAKYAGACDTLSGQWTSALQDHSSDRHLSKAKKQEAMAEHQCKSKKTASLKAGTLHYRSALKLLGVKPQA